MRGALITAGKGRARLALIATCILLPAAALRLWGLEQHGFWWDEYLSVLSATGGPWEPPESTFTTADMRDAASLSGTVRGCLRYDSGNGLLYLVLLHGWTRAFGVSETAVRMLSALLGLAVVALTAVLAWKVLDARAALVAGALASLQPLLCTYSREARAYSLATLLVLAASLALRALTARPSARWTDGPSVAFGVFAGAAFLSHYLTLPVLVAQAAAAAFVKPQTVRRLFLAGLLAAGLAGTWLLVGGADGWRHMETQNRTYVGRAGQLAPGENFALPTSPGNFVAGFVQQLAPTAGNYLQIGLFRLRQVAPMLAVPAVLVILGMTRAGRSILREPLRLAVLLASLGAVTLSSGLAVWSGHTVPFQAHYGIFAAPYMTILVAWGICAGLEARGLTRRATLALTTLQVGICALSCVFVLWDMPRGVRPVNAFRASAAHLMVLATQGDTVVFPSLLSARIHNLYLPREAAFLQGIEPSPRSTVVIRRRGGLITEYPLPGGTW